MLTELLWFWVPWIYNKTTEIVDTSNKIIKAINNELYNAKEWLFIINSSFPIPIELFDGNDIPLDKIKWNATVNPPIFKDNKCPTSNYKHISYLGFTIINPGSENIDLTDWINEVKWSGTIQPSPSEIFTLWCCKNRSPLIYYNNNLEVEIITADGDIIKKGLND